MTDRQEIMRAHTITLGLLASALLASSATLALAWPSGKEAPGIEESGSEMQSEFNLDLDPTWKLFEPGKDAFVGISTSPPAPPSSAPAAFSPEQTQGAIARAIKSGYSVAAEPEQYPAELKRGYTLTNRLTAGIRAGFDAPVGEEMRVTAAGAEARLSFGRLAPAISWGWHTGLNMSLQEAGTNAVQSGPQLKLGSDQLALTLSPKVAHSFGTHHESTIAFAYAAGLKSELSKGVALGIEAFGATSEIAAVPGTALQTHRTSPGVYVGLGLAPQPIGDANRSKFSLELGALADLTEANPDWTGKVKAAVTW
jgi:hypothetical protein